MREGFGHTDRLARRLGSLMFLAYEVAIDRRSLEVCFGLVMLTLRAAARSRCLLHRSESAEDCEHYISTPEEDIRSWCMDLGSPNLKLPYGISDKLVEILGAGRTRIVNRIGHICCNLYSVIIFMQ